MTAFLSNASNSNKLLKVTALAVANVDGTNAADITVQLCNGSTVLSHICFTLAVPADATQIALTRDVVINLEEGFNLKAQASANNDLELTYSYSEIL